MNNFIKTMQYLVVAAMAASLHMGAAQAQAAAPAGALAPLQIYGNDGNVEPNVLQIGTPSAWGMKVGNNGQKALNAGNIKVEPTKVGSANGMKVTWMGGIGQIFSQSKTAVDRFDYLEADGALVFDAVVHQAPADQVIMRVDCGYPCLGLMDTTDFFRKAPLEKQISVKLPLACFEKTGAKFGGINTPWLIFTNNTFSLSVANVRYVPGAAKDADVSAKCGT